MPSKTVIEEFLAQRHLAFVGASRDPKQFGNAVYRHLRDGGRTLYPVHPEAAEIEGDAAFIRVTDVPDPVDGLVVMVKPDAAEQVVRDAIDAVCRESGCTVESARERYRTGQSNSAERPAWPSSTVLAR